MMNRFIAHNMPKIELHCHLDGSMSLPLIQKLMQQEGKEPLGLEELREKLVAPMDCSSLAEYLEKFELPLGCLQTKEGLSAAAQDLALSAAKEQVNPHSFDFHGLWNPARCNHQADIHDRYCSNHRRPASCSGAKWLCRSADILDFDFMFLSPIPRFRFWNRALIVF